MQAMVAQFSVLLPNSARTHVALLQTGHEYAIPILSGEDGVRFHTVATVNESIMTNWQIPAIVCRCLAQDENRHAMAYAFHNLDSTEKLPPDTTWVEVGKLKDINLASTEEHEGLVQWADSLNDPSWNSIPWSRSDWYPRAKQWMLDCASKTGNQVVGEPIQIKTWSISCVFRVETTGGAIWFKALPNFWGHEPRLMQDLTKTFPQYMMDVVAIEPDEHWMMSKEWAGPEPETIEDWQIALRAFTDIQLNCTEMIDELISFGCADRRLSLLPNLLEPVLAELDDDQGRKFYEVTEAEAKELARRIRRLPALCRKLSDCGIPESVVHGDFWGPNVLVRDKLSGKAPIIFDWTDASIGHPFFDIYWTILYTKNESLRSALRQCHIDIWSEKFPREKVVEAFDLSQQIAPYYYLLACRNIEANAPADARWELVFLLTGSVRNILAAESLPAGMVDPLT